MFQLTHLKTNKMKNLFYTILSAIFIFSFTSCEPDTGDESFMDNRETIAGFTASSVTMAVSPGGSNTYKLTVAVSKQSSSDLNFDVSMSNNSTASADDYSMSSNSITIKAGELFGSVDLVANLDNASFDGKTLILELNASAGVFVGSVGSISIEIIKSCESNLAGEYTMTTTFGYHDFLPDFNPNTIDVELVALTENTYEIVGDFTGGLWGDLYAGAYGTSARSVEISDICNNISWDQTASDQFGGNITYGDSDSYYDPSTGNIIISWTCTAYGETGVSVYEPK